MGLYLVGLAEGYINTIIGPRYLHVTRHSVSCWLVGCQPLTPKRTLPRLSAVRSTSTSHVTTSNRRSKHRGRGVEFRIDRYVSPGKNSSLQQPLSDPVSSLV